VQRNGHIFFSESKPRGYFVQFCRLLQYYNWRLRIVSVAVNGKEHNLKNIQ
jgi:hypothetical protein